MNKHTRKNVQTEYIRRFVRLYIHPGLYDFGTILITWMLTAPNLRKRIIEAQEYELTQMVKKDPFQLNAISRTVRM